jgi:hypothetical protein
MCRPGFSLIAWALVPAFLGLLAAPAPAQNTVAAPATVAPVISPNDAPWLQELAAWRSQRERELAASDGWLTLIGLEWLKPGVNSVGAAADNHIQIHAEAPDHIGLLTAAGGVVQLLSPASGFPPELTIDGAPAREGPLTVNDQKPSVIAWHGLTMVVLNRGGRFALRIKDANSPTRTGFRGLNWYAPDPRFRVAAQWIPFTPPLVEHIPTVLGTTLDLPAPGVAEFTLDGQILRLVPIIEDPAGKTLFFILRDQTSQTTTYQAARFLHTGLPDNGLDHPGMLLLDFNRLENPPCAYTSYATCPLPPEANRLPVALEAGERRYAH